ncbi:unnamed protein product [Rotaria sordida]|uniref:Uncharacterized protein n=1 Tax=Rotaria sordida TaxID=392033 RepID=A0A814T615_9BILA|nr:unnamed protein product [Rotaria sordida]
MSDKNNENEFMSDNQQKAKEKKDLWQKLNIDFRLDNSVFPDNKTVFPDNKIYGTINVTPKEARDLIKEFVLAVDNSNRTVFNSKFRYISASGFDPTKNNISIHIDAIPRSPDLTRKRSNTECFSIMRQIFSFTPTVNIEWPDLGSKPNLIIQWYHLGDPVVKQYVLVLDEKEVRYIRDPSIADVYKVCINNLEPGREPTKHTIQIIAKLNHGKEPYLSDLIEVIVPNVKSENIQVITISELEEQKEDEETSSPKVANQSKDKQPKPCMPQQPQTKHNQQSDTIFTNRSCGCSKPHEEFPGIEHYLGINYNRLSSSSSLIQNTPPNQITVVFGRDKSTARPNVKDIDNNNNYCRHEKQDTDHNDDDDIVTAGNSSNK